MQNGVVDPVIGSDPVSQSGLVFEPLFDYQALLVLARNHPLTEKDYVGMALT